MTFVDHLKGNRPEDKLLEVAFGLHIIEHDLAKSESVGGVVKIQVLLGEAFGKGWGGPVGVWFRGTNRDSTKYKFYPGIMSPGNADTVQGIDSVFTLDTPHSNTAWLRLECPNGSEVGIPDPDTKTNPPVGHTGLYKCQLGDIYNGAGSVTSSGVLLVNPADVLAFGCKEIRRYDSSRIGWADLDTLRQFSDQTVTPDYTTLPQGVGLTGKYYDGTSFNTFKSQRVDPVIQYDVSFGAPALDINPAAFSGRFEGKIRFKHSETVTLYLTHNDGGKLWIDNLTTPLIDQWGTVGEHTATFAATADQFYDIKIEWNNTAGESQLKLEWSSTSQPRQVVPQDRLYPKNEAIPRFRTHIAFTQRTTFEDFLQAVLFTCNGEYHDASGQLRFFSLDQTTPSFGFNVSNIVENTFNFYPRFTQQELLSLPNRFIASGRDLDSRYLEPFDPPLFFDLPQMQDMAGRIIEETVPVGNVNRWQGLSNLKHHAKLKTAPNIAEFEGMPQTLPVLKGDKVTVIYDPADMDDHEFLVVEATDNSIDAAPDNRKFKLLDWDYEPM
jgi:hypothetical protein